MPSPLHGLRSTSFDALVRALRLPSALVAVAAIAAPVAAQVAPPLLVDDPAPIQVNGVDCAAGHLMVQVAPGVSFATNAKGETVLRSAKNARIERDSEDRFGERRHGG